MNFEQYSIPVGARTFAVVHNDNSDVGRGEHFFDTFGEATEYFDGLNDPPEASDGNHFHPAPKTLNARLIVIERVR